VGVDEGKALIDVEFSLPSRFIIMPKFNQQQQKGFKLANFSEKTAKISPPILCLQQTSNHADAGVKALCLMTAFVVFTNTIF